jgi:hypothetical protein
MLGLAQYTTWLVAGSSVTQWIMALFVVASETMVLRIFGGMLSCSTIIVMFSESANLPSDTSKRTFG